VSRDGVLLLGGTGFIGTALATRLQREGIPVRVIGREGASSFSHFLTGCRTLIHMASATTPGSSSREPDLEQANLDLTQNLVQCLRGHPKIHLIYFSSGGTVYGNPAKLPVNEDVPRAPLSPYGEAKVEQEAMCLELQADGDSAVTILRPSNAYGPGQKVKRGFGLVPTLLEHARWGTTLDVWGDGDNVRDYIFIDDIIEATLRLIRRPQDAEVYNLGSGVGYSINQVKQMVEQVTGLQIKTVYRPNRAVDVRSVVLDSTRLFERLSWQPSVQLAKGIELTWRHVSGAGKM
jgi:UDP-glucose 4-epimerase